MVKKSAGAEQELTVAHLNTFFEALQANIQASKLGEEQKESLMRDAPHEFLPIEEEARDSVVLAPQRRLPTTLSALKEVVKKSKALIRDGFDEHPLSEHAAKLEYGRIFDGAVAAVEQAMGKAR